MKFAIIRTGGKQYMVRQGDELYVDRLTGEPESEIELETLASADSESGAVELGTPALKKQVKAKIVGNLKADKVRVARFRAKSRSRKVKGFRHALTQIKVVSL